MFKKIIIDLNSYIDLKAELCSPVFFSCSLW